VHPEDIDHVKKYQERVYTSEYKQDIDELEFRIIHKNGSVVHIYHVCRPIFDASDKYRGKRISNRDITERKRAEIALQKRVKELRCIADISRLAEKHSISIEELAQGAVNILPAALLAQ
jgi:hypothetical protein